MPDCFLEGSLILCQVDGIEKYLPIESLTLGTLVRTNGHGYKAAAVIKNATMYNTATDDRTPIRMYKCTTSNYPQLTSDLYLTGCHAILVDALTATQQAEIIKQFGKVFQTDDKYRLPACVDERAQPWNSEGRYKIWHIALENTSDTTNYGIYANGLLLVETSSIIFLASATSTDMLFM